VYWQTYLLLKSYFPSWNIWRKTLFILMTEGIYYIHTIFWVQFLTILGSTFRLTPGYHSGRRTFLAMMLNFTPPRERTYVSILICEMVLYTTIQFEIIPLTLTKEDQKHINSTSLLQIKINDIELSCFVYGHY